MDKASAAEQIIRNRKGVPEAAKTSKAFPDLSPDYDLIKEYILRTYHFLAAA